jgi:hypothetical protein
MLIPSCWKKVSPSRAGRSRKPTFRDSGHSASALPARQSAASPRSARSPPPPPHGRPRPGLTSQCHSRGRQRVSVESRRQRAAAAPTTPAAVSAGTGRNSRQSQAGHIQTRRAADAAPHPYPTIYDGTGAPFRSTKRHSSTLARVSPAGGLSRTPTAQSIGPAATMRGSEHARASERPRPSRPTGQLTRQR